MNHQVVANSGAFASGPIAPNRIYATRLDTPGTYGYHDALHPTLKGTVKVTGPAPSVSIGASTAVAVFGNAIHVGGAISPAAVGSTVTILAQPSGQASFVEIAKVQTTTNGVYDLITTPQLLTAYKATWNGKTSAIVTVAAPFVVQARVLAWPVVTAVGVAVKLLIAGGATAVVAVPLFE